MNLINKYKQKIDQIFEILLHLIVLSAPFVIYGHYALGMSLRLSRMFIFLILPFLLLKILQAPFVLYRDKFLIFGILPFVLFTSASLTWTSSTAFTFGMNRLLSLYEVMVVYVIFIVADLDHGRFLKVMKSYVVSSFVPILISSWQIVNNFIQFSVAEVPFSNFLISGKYDILKDRTSYMSYEGHTRISASFAEPTVFGCFMSTILLASLFFEFKERKSVYAFRLFQFVCFVCMVLSLSKLSIIAFTFGIIIIFRKYKIKLVSYLILGATLLVLSYFIINSYSHTDYLSKRFLTDSGHFKLLMQNLNELKKINLILGNGIGGIPIFSTNKFLISRIYENGVFGLLFAIVTTLMPLWVLIKKEGNVHTANLKNVSLGILMSILLIFHLYDNFIYISPWILIGAIMSFSLNTQKES